MDRPCMPSSCDIDSWRTNTSTVQQIFTVFTAIISEKFVHTSTMQEIVLSHYFTWREIVEKDRQACKLNRENTMDHNRRRKQIRDDSRPR